VVFHTDATKGGTVSTDTNKGQIVAVRPIERDLFGNPVDPTAPYAPGSATSKEAARLIRPAVNACQMRVFRFIRDHQPVTREQIGGGLDMPGSTVRPRVKELLDRGVIVECNGDDGRTVETRQTRSGRKAVCLRTKAGTRWNDLT